MEDNTSGAEQKGIGGDCGGTGASTGTTSKRQCVHDAVGVLGRGIFQTFGKGVPLKNSIRHLLGRNGTPPSANYIHIALKYDLCSMIARINRKLNDANLRRREDKLTPGKMEARFILGVP